MPTKQNINLAAFTAACVNAFSGTLANKGVSVETVIGCRIDEGTAHLNNMVGSGTWSKICKSANKAANAIIAREPLLLNDKTSILVSEDEHPKDHRDIILRKTLPDGTIHEIGIAVRWNSVLAKSAKMARTGFGLELFGHHESESWKTDTDGIWSMLESLEGQPWSSIADKDETIYRPLLDAFIDETLRMTENHLDAPFNFAQSVVGRRDYWEITGGIEAKSVLVRGFALHGYLAAQGDLSMNENAHRYPTKIVEIGRKDDCTGIAEIIMDNGWAFTLRIHGGEGIIRTGLKMDIRFTGTPFAEMEETWNTSYSGSSRRKKNG